MLPLEKRYSYRFIELDDKTYEEAFQLCQRKYGKLPPTKAHIRLLVNKFRRTCDDVVWRVKNVLEDHRHLTIQSRDFT
ncbi:hypothetical protein TNCT_261341 [Trichonephila clavata]|uniref:Uncharacterized protein n=1 Tax=Trichonephila clavata TaxID=2740835 RepID=A0A8X6L914_TRICU|nr:hypothetical protein TNCT_261341 [Trichonephila clavata]